MKYKEKPIIIEAVQFAGLPDISEYSCFKAPSYHRRNIEDMGLDELKIFIENLVINHLNSNIGKISKAGFIFYYKEKKCKSRYLISVKERHGVIIKDDTELVVNFEICG